MRVLWTLVLVVGCQASGPSGSPVESAAPPEAPATPATPTDAPAEPGIPSTPPDDGATLDPAALYAACQDRLEQPEEAGECSSDADCTRAGCSQEVCTSTAGAADLMSTCEVRPCFQAVSTCGCVDGRCRWSLADKVVPAPMQPLPQ